MTRNVKFDGGYEGNSMSKRARWAYEKGLFPASKIKEVSTKLIKEFCRYEEWHHTSGNYNITEFYNPEYVLATFGLIESEDYPANLFAVEALEEWKSKKGDVETYENCTVKWLEWSGSRRYPKAEEIEVKGCKVSVKGQTATITLPDGKSFKKRLSTKGFSFTE